MENNPTYSQSIKNYLITNIVPRLASIILLPVFLRIVEVELALADLETTQKQLLKIEKAAKSDKSIGQILESLKHASEQLDQGIPIYKSDLTSSERELLSDFFLLTFELSTFIISSI